MASKKKKKKSAVPSHQNFVHKNMVEMHSCVAMKSGKDYDRKKSKEDVKRGLEDC